MRLQYAAMCEEKAQLAEAKLEVKSFLANDSILDKVIPDQAGKKDKLDQRSI